LTREIIFDEDKGISTGDQQYDPTPINLGDEFMKVFRV